MLQQDLLSDSSRPIIFADRHIVDLIAELYLLDNDPKRQSHLVARSAE